MVGLGPNQTKSMGTQRQGHFRDLEQRRDWEGSVHTTHTSRSHSQGGSHLSHEKNTKAMQLEIDHLKRSLHHERQKRAPSNFDFSSDNEKVSSYRRRSRTPPMMRTTITSVEIEIHLRKAWEMMLWVEHLTKFSDHLSRAELREEDFLNGSLSPRSSCIMVEQTLWSMLATSIKEWLCTLRIRPWCARYSHPA